MSDERNEGENARKGPMESIQAEVENDLMERFQNGQGSLEECIELVRESLDEIYAEKIEEMNRKFVTQIEELTEETEILREEVRKLKREKEIISSQAGIDKNEEQHIRNIIEESIRGEYQAKYQNLERDLFERFQKETEDIMNTVQDEIEELLVSKGLTKERRLEIEEQVKDEMRQQISSTHDNVNENSVYYSNFSLHSNLHLRGHLRDTYTKSRYLLGPNTPKRRPNLHSSSKKRKRNCEQISRKRDRVSQGARAYGTLE